MSKKKLQLYFLLVPLFLVFAISSAACRGGSNNSTKTSDNSNSSTNDSSKTPDSLGSVSSTPSDHNLSSELDTEKSKSVETHGLDSSQQVVEQETVNQIVDDSNKENMENDSVSISTLEKQKSVSDLELEKMNNESVTPSDMGSFDNSVAWSDDENSQSKLPINSSTELDLSSKESTGTDAKQEKENTIKKDSKFYIPSDSDEDSGDEHNTSTETVVFSPKQTDELIPKAESQMLKELEIALDSI